MSACSPASDWPDTLFPCEPKSNYNLQLNRRVNNYPEIIWSRGLPVRHPPTQTKKQKQKQINKTRKTKKHTQKNQKQTKRTLKKKKNPKASQGISSEWHGLDRDFISDCQFSFEVWSSVMIPHSSTEWGLWTLWTTAGLRLPLNLLTDKLLGHMHPSNW